MQAFAVLLAVMGRTFSRMISFKSAWRYSDRPKASFDLGRPMPVSYR